MKKQDIANLKAEGYTILRSYVSTEWLDTMSDAADRAFAEHKRVQAKYNNEIQVDGVALHVLLSDSIFVDFLQNLLDIGFVKELQEHYFHSNCILNSFSALNNLPKPNFSATVHRDLRFYSGSLPVMLNCLVMVDDFTVDRGATYLLPGSHLEEKKWTDEEFYAKAIQATGKRGDILIFDSNVWHAAAPNLTQDNRRGLPITLSRSFMKQLLDYPRALGYDRMDEFSPEMQQLLGYHSRVPANLDEWYQPNETRFYKKDQD